jgi:urease accessory protein UreF
MALIARLTHPATIALLSYHIEWLQPTSISEEQAIWIYGLLLRLDTLLQNDQVAILRDLSRKCMAIRNAVHTLGDYQVAACNMIITIVSMTFQQGDLN